MIPKSRISIWVFVAFSISFSINAVHSFAQQQGYNGNEIERWLANLESEDFSERTKATRQLSQAGMAAVRPLINKMLDGQPESVMRCSRILATIAQESEQNEMTRIARVMYALADNGFGFLRNESLQIGDRWKAAQVQRTVQRLNETGIQVQAVNMGGRLGGLGGGWSTTMPYSPDFTVGSGGDSEESFSLPTNKNAIIDRIDEIFESTEEANTKQFEREISGSSQGSPNDNIAKAPDANAIQEFLIIDGEARIVLRGADGVMRVSGTSAMGGSASPYTISISDSFKGDEDDLALLRLLPSISMVSVQGIEISDDILNEIKTNTLIQTVALESCTYDLEKLFSVIQARPELSVTATGHDSFMGVQLQTNADGANEPYCAILEVIEGTAAADAGCMAGDVVLKMNGVAIKTYEQMIVAIGSCSIGDEVSLDIRRDEKQMNLKMTLRKRPDDQ